MNPEVKLVHGQYPMHGRPSVGSYASVGAAKRAVRAIYQGKVGWWFQIYKNGREVWSSDHELAK